MAEPSVHGCIHSVFWKGPPNRFCTQVKFPIIQTKTPPTANGGGVFSFRAGNKPQATSAICTRIFFMAFFSSWRIRSADTPYLSASSCNVDLLSDNQRSRRIS